MILFSAVQTGHRTVEEGYMLSKLGKLDKPVKVRQGTGQSKKVRCCPY
jgi:hypothetical protein